MTGDSLNDSSLASRWAMSSSSLLLLSRCDDKCRCDASSISDDVSSTSTDSSLSLSFSSTSCSTSCSTTCFLDKSESTLNESLDRADDELFDGDVVVDVEIKSCFIFVDDVEKVLKSPLLLSGKAITQILKKRKQFFFRFEYTKFRQVAALK